MHQRPLHGKQSRPPRAHVTAMLSASAASVPGAARQGFRDRVRGCLREQEMLLSQLPGMVPSMP